MDVNALSGSNAEALRSLRSEFPQLPLVLLADQEHKQTLLDALTFGIQECLPRNRLSGAFLPLALQGAVERAKEQVFLLSNAAVKAVEQRQDLLAMLAHDLKGPIAGVDRALELLLKGSAGELKPEQQALVAKVRISNARLLKAVGNLLDVFRYDYPHTPQDIEMSSIDLVRVLQRCLADVAQFARDCHQNLQVNLPDSPVIIKGHESAVQRLFLNLLDNAVKFTPEHGSISVTVEPHDEFVWVWIADTGLGIEPDDLDKLFRRFWQGKPGKNFLGGTGLGLYLCRRIVEEHKGEITCASKPGEGTTFGVRLPCDRRHSAP